MRPEHRTISNVLFAAVAAFVTVCICITCSLLWGFLRESSPPQTPFLPPFQLCIVNNMVEWWFFEVLAIIVVACFIGVLCVKGRPLLFHIYIASCIVLSCIVMCVTFFGLMALVL